MVPKMVKDTWPEDLVEDAILAFLTRLVESPLPHGIDNLPGYLSRAFRNHCIDLYEARRRRMESSVEGRPPGWEPPAWHDESPAEVAARRERAGRLHQALQRLEIADRVVLKLEHAPEWLDGKEIGWLAGRQALDQAEMWEAILAAEDMHALTRVFDPGDVGLVQCLVQCPIRRVTEKRKARNPKDSWLPTLSGVDGTRRQPERRC